MGHNHSYFADIHASKLSQFYDTPHDVPDSPDISLLRSKLLDTPDNTELIKLLADKLNFQLRYRESIELYNHAIKLHPDDRTLYRLRAPRYLNTLQIQKAYDDYLFCERSIPDTLDISYRLGIAAYMLGSYPEAESLFVRSMLYAVNDPEMLVAAAYWRALTAFRSSSNDNGWRKFDFALNIEHHYGYRDALLLLCGLTDADDSFRMASDNDDSLNGCIVLYALYAYYIREHNLERADEIMKILIDWDDFWPGFAYLAAWLDFNTPTA